MTEWLGWTRSGKVWLAGAAAVVVVVALLLLALRPLSVTVAEVTVRDIQPAVVAVGTVEAKVALQVSAKIGGRLRAVLVDQGDPVKIGQVLARLDDSQALAEVRKSAAAVEAVEAQLKDLEAGSRPEEIAEARANVRRAQAQLDDLQAGARRQEIEEARERLRSATATRALAEADLRRLETLKARELIAAQEADRGRQAFEVAAAQERSAKENLDMLVEGSRAHQVDAARALRESTQNRLALLLAGPRPHQREAARAALREAQAALTLVRERHADTVITSPLDGHVVSRDVEPGATVNPGTTILKLTDPRTFWVTVHVDERETGGIGAGDAADITLRSLAGRTLPGRVARVRRESDRVTEQLAVDVAFVEAPGRLTLGEQAEATIKPPPRKGVAALPLLAVIRGRGGLGVWTVSDGRLGWRTVELGAADASGWAEVRVGLRAGEQVVVSPGRSGGSISEGRRVTVRHAAAEAAASPRP